MFGWRWVLHVCVLTSIWWVVKFSTLRPRPNKSAWWTFIWRRGFNFWLEPSASAFYQSSECISWFNCIPLLHPGGSRWLQPRRLSGKIFSANNTHTWTIFSNSRQPMHSPKLPPPAAPLLRVYFPARTLLLYMRHRFSDKRTLAPHSSWFFIAPNRQ